MFGFINLNKPLGLTSHDCVYQVRRILKLKRVGHGGTLDPAASGVLPIAVGKATRLLRFLPQDKVYRAVIRLGVRTATDDLEGKILQQQPVPSLRLEEVEPYLKRFRGAIEQIPPAYSAIQQDGKRLYELARAGKEVKAAARKVEINNIEVLGWNPGEYPELELMIACGSGTYIRAIARDLGAALNVGGTLAALKRTRSCGLELADSISLEQVAASQLIDPTQVLGNLKVITLNEFEAKRWCHGQTIAYQQIQPEDQIVQVKDNQGNFLGISKLVLEQDKLWLAPEIVVASFG